MLRTVSSFFMQIRRKSHPNAVQSPLISASNGNFIKICEQRSCLCTLPHYASDKQNYAGRLVLDRSTGVQDALLSTYSPLALCLWHIRCPRVVPMVYHICAERRWLHAFLATLIQDPAKLTHVSLNFYRAWINFNGIWIRICSSHLLPCFESNALKTAPTADHLMPATREASWSEL